MADTQRNQQQRAGEDVVKAAQILFNQLQRPLTDRTPSQTVSTPSASFSSHQQSYDDRRMSSITYSEVLDQGLAFTETTGATVEDTARSISHSSSPSAIQNITGVGNSSQEQTDIIEAAEAARILFDLHRVDNSLARIPVDLLSVPGRSGLRSRGVLIRRQGAQPVNERLSTEQAIGEEEAEGDIEGEGEESDNEDDEDNDEEYQAATRRARRPALRRSKQDREDGEKKERKSRRKTPHGAPRDYQRHSVRDGKGRFIKREE